MTCAGVRQDAAGRPAGHWIEGGRLILYHGWADQAIPPWSTLDYYAAVERAAGGFRASQSFSRLYMIPGAYHCLAAPDGSINTADFLTPLISWVQDGIGPGAVPANTYSQGKITRRYGRNRIGHRNGRSAAAAGTP